MGKDRQGKFHPPAGKPSGQGKQTENIVNEQLLKQQSGLENKYDIDPDTNESAEITTIHRNRCADKKEDRGVRKKSKNGLNKIRKDALTENSSATKVEQLKLSKETLRELSLFTNGPCVSAYFPTHRTGLEVNEQVDPIFLKNVLQRAQQELEPLLMDAPHELLETGYELLGNEGFWKSISAPGLAFFIGKGFFKYALLPEVPLERLQINDAFLIGPLVPYAINPDFFYLLLISKKQSKLFRADRFSIQYIPLPEMPNGIEDVVHLEEKDDQNLFRTGSSGAGGGANYHGMESGIDEKKNIGMYLAEVDSTVRKEVLHDQHVPLLLAGIDYMVAIYKKITHYGNVWDAVITGSHEYDNKQMLHRESLQVMKEYFDEEKKKALSEYGDQSATERTSSIPEDIIRAAFSARISALFIRKDATLWGSFNEDSDQLILHENEDEDDENLADKTIVKTVLNGGRVYMVDEQEVPQQSVMAATMRF